MKRSLLLGCGSRRDRIIGPPGTEAEGWGELITVDLNPDHKPDLVWDLTNPTPLPWPDDFFDEIHAYEVIEHLGDQGDYLTLFRQFTDYWRLLKPGGYFCATVPWWNKEWAWGDPSHRRVITPGTLVFLNQEEYRKQVGVTPMSDFRAIYRADFETVGITGPDTASMGFVLRCIKPARLS